MQASRDIVEELAASGQPVYGVSTGFGSLADVYVEPASRARLQAALIRSHAAGMGDAVEPEVVRAMMLLRARTLAMGRSGARPVLADRLLDLLAAGITPRVPEHGSLGCSGDLAPLAHVALVLLGEGEVVEGRDYVDAAVALGAAGIDPIVLEAKEGLALVNGTDGMLGMLALACHDVRGLLAVADIVAAMSVEALLGTDAVFAPEILALRPHPGQAASAENMRRVLEGSPIVASHRVGDSRVQDAYSLRCAPQVHGAVRDALGYVEGVVRRELDSAIDNPVVLPDGRVTSNGNFHGAPLAHAADFLAIVLADLGSMSERRVDRLLDPARSHGLPAFLADEPGVDSGLMIAQYTAAALVDENRRLATPASVASIPTSAMQEDHVSMGWAAARKLRVVVAEPHAAARDRARECREGSRAARTVAARRGDRRRDRGAASGRARARPRSVAHTRARGRDRARRGGRAAVGGRVGDGSTAVTEGARPVRAPRGTTLTCKAWPQEAAMRMLMNNLDPEVAERPDDLVVYGGTGRAARSWAAFDALVATLRTLEGDETMLVQSGKPVGVFRTHEWAPRVLIANSNLVPDWATWEEFRRLEALGLTMYGQMTAGSWIYIGTQGILQGTYECFAEIARRRFGGSLRGTITLTAGLGGMGGAQPLAITMNDGVALCIEVDPHRIERRLETRYLDEAVTSLDDAIARCQRREGRGPRAVDRAPRQRG